MSSIRIRRLLLRPRTRLAVVLALLALAVAVSAHHGGPMGDMHGMGAAAAVICLAVLGVASAFAFVMPPLKPRLRLPSAIAPTRLRRALARPVACARAGPRYLELSVIRR